MHNDVTAWWMDEIRRHPVLVFWLIVFAVHCGMNMNLGYVIGGGEGFPALAYAACFLGFAGLGAWAADQWLHGATQWRAGLLVMALAQFGIGQMAGWQSFGLTLEKGAAGLEGKADLRKTAKDRLEAQRAERLKIGTPRPIGSIEAEENLECQIKSKVYKDGVGPKCTALRSELRSARRAAELDELIGTSSAALEAAPKVKDANALYAAPQALAQMVLNLASSVFGGKTHAVTPDDVRFGWMVFLVAALEFFGTFGLAIIRSFGRTAPEPPPGGRGPRVDGYARAVDPEPQGHGPRGGAPGGAHSLRDAVEAVLGGAPARLLPSPAPVPQLAAPSLHGAPINIHLGGYPPFVAPSDAHVMSKARVPHDASGAAIAGGQLKAQEERHDLAALSADAPPVDRSRMRREIAPEEREAADVILAFRAACVVDTPGGVVDAENIYRRYAAWAGERALAREAFAALFAAATGLEAVAMGGLPHYRGVALRVGRRLEAVA